MENYHNREKYYKDILNYRNILNSELLAQIKKDLDIISKKIRFLYYKNKKNTNGYAELNDYIKNSSYIIKDKYSLQALGRGSQGFVIKLEVNNLINIAIKSYYNLKDIEPDKIYPFFTNRLVTNRISPNFVVSSIDVFNDKYILMELLNGTINDLIKEHKFSDLIWKGFYFQLFHAIHTLFKTEWIIHHDLTVDNVFYKNIKDDYIYFRLTDPNENILILKIPTGNKLILIGDYGLSQRIKNINYAHAKKLAFYGEINYDLFNFFSKLEYKLIVDLSRKKSLTELKQISYENNDQAIDSYIENSLAKIQQNNIKETQNNPRFYAAMYLIKKKYIFQPIKSSYNFPTRETFYMLRDLIGDNLNFIEKVKKYFNEFIIDEIDNEDAIIFDYNIPNDFPSQTFLEFKH